MKYESGSKKQVMRSLINYAIRDQEALIDAHLNWEGEPISKDGDTMKVITDCQALIRDFNKLRKTLR